MYALYNHRSIRAQARARVGRGGGLQGKVGICDLRGGSGLRGTAFPGPPAAFRSARGVSVSRAQEAVFTAKPDGFRGDEPRFQKVPRVAIGSKEAPAFVEPLEARFPARELARSTVAPPQTIKMVGTPQNDLSLTPPLQVTVFQDPRDRGILREPGNVAGPAVNRAQDQ